MSTTELDVIFAIVESILVLMIIVLGLSARWFDKREVARQGFQSPQDFSKLNGQERLSAQAAAQLAYLQELVARAESKRRHGELDSNKEHADAVTV